MYMASVTDVRKGIRKILAEVVHTKEPAVILQRSRPVAYLVDAETFEEMQRRQEHDNLAGHRKNSLNRILQLREQVAAKTGVLEDSTPLIRELREGPGRCE